MVSIGPTLFQEPAELIEGSPAGDIINHSFSELSSGAWESRTHQLIPLVGLVKFKAEPRQLRC